MAEEEALKSIWNFDGAELNLIFEIKAEAGTNIKNWDVEAAYWSLRDLRRELDAKFDIKKKEDYEFKDKEGKIIKKNITEKEFIDHLILEIEVERNKFLESEQEDSDNSRFYLVLEEFYMKLSTLMKKHGLYFREGDDPSKAIWRK